MRFLLHGPNEFLLHRKLDSIRSRFMEMRDATGLNVVRLHRKEHGVESVAEAFFASPFLAERKMVLLEGFLSGPADGQEEFAALLSRKSDAVVAVFIEDVERKKIEKSPLFPLLSAEKFTEHFPHPTPAEVETFLVNEAAAEGRTLDRADAQLLIAVAGDDLRRLHNELGKLCAHAAARGDRAITRTAITDLNPGATLQDGADMFAFIDACTAGQCASAATMLEDMLEGGASEYQVVAMLERQFRTLVAAADAHRAGARPDPARFAADLGLHPFPAGKALAASRRRPYDWYDARHRALLDLDRKSKSGPGSLRAMLTAFVHSLK